LMPNEGLNGYRNSFDIKELRLMLNMVKCGGPLELQGQASPSLVASMV
jgi:hypothetical protein